MLCNEESRILGSIFQSNSTHSTHLKSIWEQNITHMSVGHGTRIPCFETAWKVVLTQAHHRKHGVLTHPSSGSLPGPAASLHTLFHPVSIQRFGNMGKAGGWRNQWRPGKGIHPVRETVDITLCIQFATPEHRGEKGPTAVHGSPPMAYPNPLSPHEIVAPVSRTKSNQTEPVNDILTPNLPCPPSPPSLHPKTRSPRKGDRPKPTRRHQSWAPAWMSVRDAGLSARNAEDRADRGTWFLGG